MARAPLFWIELSRTDRDQTDAWLRSLKDDETADSLGLAALLESLSDHLYPGTVTGMTRARYFLLVPLLYRRIARRPQHDVVQQSKELQVTLSKAIPKTERGNIGVRAGDTLTRFPSSIYWSRLNTLGILREDVSESEYLAAVADVARRRIDDDDGGQRASSDPESWWAPDIACDVALAKNRFERATLELPSRERRALCRRFLERTEGSLLAHCVDKAKPLPQSGPWPMRLPRGPLRDAADHARGFRALQRCASLLYARFVAENRRAILATKEDFRAIDDALDAWLHLAKRDDVLAFDARALHDLVGLKAPRDERRVAFLQDLRARCASASAARDLLSKTRGLFDAREETVRGRSKKRRIGATARRDLLTQWRFAPGTTDGLYESSTRHSVARRIISDLLGNHAL